MPKKHTVPTGFGGWHALALPGHSASTRTPFPFPWFKCSGTSFHHVSSYILNAANGPQACWQELLLFVVTDVASHHPSAGPTILGCRRCPGLQKGISCAPCISEMPWPIDICATGEGHVKNETGKRLCFLQPAQLYWIEWCPSQLCPVYTVPREIEILVFSWGSSDWEKQ